MMALSKCVLDRVEERKNELKGRMYGLVKIMSRSVFARIQKRTSLYKDLLDQLVEQVFNKFTQELNEAWRDGCAYGRDLESSSNQHISNDEEYVWDSEIEAESLSTLESQASSPEQSLDDCIHLVKLVDPYYDGEECYSIMAQMDGVDQCVLDRVEEKKNEFKDRAYGLVEIISRTVFARMEKRTSVYTNLLDQLVEQVFNMFTQELNDAWRDGCSYGQDEWNEYSDFDDLFANQPEINNLDSIESLSSQQQQSSPHHSNEDSSLHSSSTQSQPSSQSQHQNIIQDVSDSGVMSDSMPLSSSPSQASSPQQSLQECKFYEEVHDGEYTENNCDDDVMGNMCTDDQDKEQSEEYDQDDQISANDEKLSLVNGHVDGDWKNDEVDVIDGDYQLGVDQLNGLEHRENIHVADSQEVVLNKSQTGKHVCTQCRISFSTLSDLNRHTRKYTVSKLFKCPQVNCYKTFSQNTDLQVHFESHSEQHKQEKKEDMDIGLRVEENERSGKGSRGNDLDNEQIDGDEDDEDVGNNEELTVNGQMGDDDEDFGHGVDQLNGLEHRNNNIDGNEAQKAQLVQNKSTGQVAVPDKSPPTGKIACEHCGKVFKRKYNLTLHIRTHTGDRPYKCPKCPKTFNQSAHMKQHIKSLHDKLQTVGKLACSYCAKTFPSKYKLENHIRTHTGERPHKCPFDNCNAAFAQIGAMQGHYTRLHTEHRPYICEHCGKRFASQFEVTRHMRVHTGEKPYKCPFDNCNAAFAQLNAMKLHHKSHTGQLKHACAHCSTRFKTPGLLKIHIRRHTGEKPFQCTWKDCAMDFISKQYLDRHYITHGSNRVHSIQSVPSDK